MPTNHAALIVHFLGFIAGAALYAMLLAMVLRSRAYAVRASWPAADGRFVRLPTDRLPLLTALLGLFWNLGGLVAYAHRDLAGGEPLPLVVAASYTALGFLPAVVVHAALHATGATSRAQVRAIHGVAYGLAVVASVMHFHAALELAAAPSQVALTLLTVGFAALIGTLFVTTRGQTGRNRAVWAVALAVFAVSALHLGSDTGHDSWWVELVGHHASLPLALAILYQDYRFALADIFLKRALLLIALVAVAFGAYLLIDPLLAVRDAGGASDPRAVGAVIALLVATALAHPLLRALVSRFVDTVVLQRTDYALLRADIARLSAEVETPEEVLSAVCERLAPAISSYDVRWSEAQATPDATGDETLVEPLVALFSPDGGQLAGTLLVPTAEAPQYLLEIGALGGGRRLLSDDVAMLESVAQTVARRIDALRVNHERCERGFREQEIGKLASEAELRALRAQLNPHFLFNALTTVGYLIQTSPELALETLMRLTGLLRAVLKRSSGEFVTLGEELDLVDAYLAIERARFEERLRVVVDVPAELRTVRVPLLLVQPLVENAVKHGISPRREGGEVRVTARLDPAEPETLVVVVRDSGVGASESDLARGRSQGVGLASVERRLEVYFGDAGVLEIETSPGEGTSVALRMPVGSLGAAQSAAPLRSGA